MIRALNAHAQVLVPTESFEYSPGQYLYSHRSVCLCGWTDPRPYPSADDAARHWVRHFENTALGYQLDSVLGGYRVSATGTGTERPTSQTSRLAPPA